MLNLVFASRMLCVEFAEADLIGNGGRWVNHVYALVSMVLIPIEVGAAVNNTESLTQNQVVYANRAYHLWGKPVYLLCVLVLLV